MKDKTYRTLINELQDKEDNETRNIEKEIYGLENKQEGYQKAIAEARQLIMREHSNTDNQKAGLEKCNLINKLKKDIKLMEEGTIYIQYIDKEKDGKSGIDYIQELLDIIED